jgi:hypothetical protein
MTERFYWVTCKNRDHSPSSILLPLPILRETPPNQLLWPMDGLPRNILCPDCWHAYEYTQLEVQSGFGDLRGLSREKTVDTMFRFEARCGEEDCGAPVYILLPGTSLTKLLLSPTFSWFEKGKHGVVRCSHEHLTARIRSESAQLQRDPSFWM